MQRIRRRKGASLIEMLFAVFMVAICAAIMASTMPMASSGRKRADTQNKAVGLAQKQLEALRGIGYANLTGTQMNTYGLIDSATPVATNTWSFTNSDGATNDNVSGVLPGGTGTVEVTQVGLDLRQIVVTVRWNSRTGQREVRLGTLVANL